jgi:hypothetical protein
MARLIHDVLYRVDWAAVSTVVLTVITGYYAWNTRHMLHTGSRQATAAERTVEILLGERRRQIEQSCAPLLSMVHRGYEKVARWSALDFDSLRKSGEWPESRELEFDELPTLIAQTRALHFPTSQALIAAEEAIVRARYELDEMITARGDEQFETRKDSAVRQLHELSEAWARAEAELAAWK